MKKFLKDLYEPRTSNFGDIALVCLLWFGTFVGIPITIVDVLRDYNMQHPFSHHTQVLIAVLFFISVAGAVIIGVERALLDDYDHKRGFFRKDK